MNNRFLAATILALIAAPAFGQAVATPPTATPAPAPAAKEDLVPVAIDTNLGRIVIALDRGHAPITTANFLHYVDNHRFDGQTFYRAVHQDDGGLIQAGITTDARKLFAPIVHEATSKTGLHNVAGAVAMANSGPGTARSDFFILLSDMPGLDAGGPGGDANGFAVFGRVTEGMDVVKKIFASPLSPTKGSGAMKGQMLDPPIRIVRATRVK